MCFSTQDKKYYPTAEEVYGPDVEVSGCAHAFCCHGASGDLIRMWCSQITSLGVHL